MAHFRGSIHGCRGEASRLGSKKSGLVTRANGWDGGVTVNLYVDGDGNNCAYVTLTNGSGFDGPTIQLYDGKIDQKTRETLRASLG